MPKTITHIQRICMQRAYDMRIDLVMFVIVIVIVAIMCAMSLAQLNIMLPLASSQL